MDFKVGDKIRVKQELVENIRNADIAWRTVFYLVLGGTNINAILSTPVTVTYITDTKIIVEGSLDFSIEQAQEIFEKVED